MWLTYFLEHNRILTIFLFHVWFNNCIMIQLLGQSYVLCSGLPNTYCKSSLLILTTGNIFLLLYYIYVMRLTHPSHGHICYIYRHVKDGIKWSLITLQKVTDYFILCILQKTQQAGKKERLNCYFISEKVYQNLNNNNKLTNNIISTLWFIKKKKKNK